jgi:hypothetical protein
MVCNNVYNYLEKTMIKSQDDLNPCNDGHRSSEVLVATIEKLEQTQKKLDMAIKCLEDCREEFLSYWDSGAEGMADGIEELLTELRS